MDAQHQAALPHRLQGHYCRACGTYFAEMTDDGASPHAQVWRHKYNKHRAYYSNEYYSCSRYCEEREQYEEVEQGRRLYGIGVPPPERERWPTLKAQHDKLFPPD